MTRIVRRLRRSLLTARLPRPAGRPFRLEVLEGRETPAVISGTVFYDFNGNGKQDPGEIGIKAPVIAVALDEGANGTIDATTTTNATGQYTFSNVPDGVNKVTVTVPTGFTATSPDPLTVTITGGVDATNQNFALQPTGKITGVVFEDKNDNGVLDPGESVIPGATVTGHAFADGTIDFTATTDKNGVYTFTGVPDGTTRVAVTPPAGYTALPTSAADVTVTGAGTASQLLGVAKPAVVGGVVFQDYNGNGKQDANEPGLSGATVTLDAGTAGAVTTTSGPTGAFGFTAVPDGTHTVAVTTPADYTAVGGTSQTVAVAGGASVTNLGFALQPAGQISGVVYNDANANGKQDAGEGPVAGATVTLDRGADGTVESTVTTDAAGKYTFTGVPDGPNVITATAPGFALDSTTVTVANGAAATQDLGLLKQAVVTGVVFNDVNGNKVQDPGEPGLAGVTVTLDAGATGTVTTTTDAGGRYTFAGVPNGTSKIAVVAPAGNTVTSTNPLTVAITGGSGLLGEDFAVQVTGEVTGVVFQDKNANGVQDAGEAPLPGVTVTLDEGATGTPQFTTTTDANGKYTFTNVPNGVNVVAAKLVGYTATTTNPAVVSVAGGATATDNIGLAPAAVVSGVAFEDLNGNGTQDAGEPGLSGVTVTLQGPNGAAPMTATTDANGRYAFSGVADGASTVTVTAPAGFDVTSANPTTAVVSGGTPLTTQNFALEPAGQISGVVFADTNANGKQDPGEQALAGATVTVTSGGFTRTATTDATGKYTVTGVPDGAVAVTVTLAGYTPATVTDTVSGGGAVTQNVGLTPAAVVSGVVFNDLNGNGTQDAGEPGLSGVTVTIDAGGSAPLTATSGANGAFTFTGVPNGFHILTVTAPAGYTPVLTAGVPFAISGGASLTGLPVPLKAASATGQISGVVFTDTNGNGVQDAGEPAAAGVTVTATPTAGGATLVATTDAAGNYTFITLPAGTYKLSATGGTNLSAAATVSLAAGGSVTQNLGLTPASTVTVTVFNDLNGNGVRDANEPVTSGVTVTLTPTGGTAQTAVTNAAGQVTFTNLANGTATVGITLPGSTVTTTATTVTVQNGVATPNQIQIGYEIPGSATRIAVSTGSPTTTPVTVLSSTGQSVTPAGPLTLNPAAGVRVAVGDVNGDGVPDYALGTAPGVATLVEVFDGKTGAMLFSVQPFEASFTGGVFVALGDLTGDGRADLVVTPDQGGGPRVEVFDAGAGFAKIADFYGIADPNFRGGARAAVGDINRDGIGDLVVAAGFGGGPRIAAFDGRTVRANQTPQRLFNDFYAFEQTLRNGVYVAVGDLNGDGYGDIIAGGGPGGGPRVFAVSGADLLSSGGATLTPLANFFAGGADNDRTGVKVATKDLDGDGRSDIVAAYSPSTGGVPRVAAYLAKTITPTGGTPPAYFDVQPYPGYTGELFVG